MNPLEMVSEDDLWEEIKKRNCAAILVTLRTYDGNREGVTVSYAGGKFVCIGLASHLMNKVMEESMEGDELEGED